jgi:probable rRNA maturation factor
MREYAFLIAHSVLHLIGYDHMTEEDAEDMFRKQDEVLSELGITRE